MRIPWLRKSIEQPVAALIDIQRLGTTLVDIVNDDVTDKNTIHKYLGVYENMMSSKKYSAKNVLEIGVFYGGSIQLWYNYFPNATIYGLDMWPADKHAKVNIFNNPRIKLYTHSNAYDEDAFKRNFLDKNIKFDVLLDDGPHHLETMKTFVRMYSQIMADDGILIVEDLDNIEWLDVLMTECPDKLKPFIKTYDLRSMSVHQNSILFVIDKSKTN
jgi:hypothetical protein